ncbi:MAG TPA: hypothetical protein VKT52_09235 [Ktedonobacterales bacterium]|nr:hypothetical protein [Ktedonobacterales bacterium]
MARLTIDDDFDGALDLHWTATLFGGGTLEIADSSLRLALPGATSRRYADAQMDDCTGRSLSRYPWRPPLRLEVRARASHPILADAPDAPASLHGTVGFGFWNYPLTLGGGIPRLPDAIWFFGASPPSNMALVHGMPSCGWKAQVVHAHRWQSLAAGVPALGAMAWARLSGDDRAAVRWVGRVTGAHESLLDDSLTEWHEYALEWRTGYVRFWVDGHEVLMAPDPPAGPLGFVTWIDNQYAVATPRGAFRFGRLDSGPEWLEIDRLRITPL